LDAKSKWDADYAKRKRIKAILDPMIPEFSVRMGGATIRQGDLLVLDADGVAVVERERVTDVLEASRERAQRELVKRAKLEAGALSFELDGLRQRLQEARHR